jgi:hypothetical protein
MAPRLLTILTGRNLPKILQPREPEPSTINDKTIADFTRVVEQMGFYLAMERPCSIQSQTTSTIWRTNPTSSAWV